MTRTVDPNEVLMTGENSFMRLGQREGGDFTTRASHWRVHYSPAGPGHALFLSSELTENQVVAYSDNIALARWLQQEIESTFFEIRSATEPPFAADLDIPVIDAAFERVGDVRSYITEEITTADVDLCLTWYDMIEPMAVHAPPGVRGRPLGVYTIIIPARRAQLSLDGDFAAGRPLRADREGNEATTACLAWSESWVRAR